MQRFGQVVVTGLGLGLLGMGLAPIALWLWLGLLDLDVAPTMYAIYPPFFPGGPTAPSYVPLLLRPIALLFTSPVVPVGDGIALLGVWALTSLRGPNRGRWTQLAAGALLGIEGAAMIGCWLRAQNAPHLDPLVADDLLRKLGTPLPVLGAVALVVGGWLTLRAVLDPVSAWVLDVFARQTTAVLLGTVGLALCAGWLWIALEPQDLHLWIAHIMKVDGHPFPPERLEELRQLTRLSPEQERVLTMATLPAAVAGCFALLGASGLLWWDLRRLVSSR